MEKILDDFVARLNRTRFQIAKIAVTVYFIVFVKLLQGQEFL